MESILANLRNKIHCLNLDAPRDVVKANFRLILDDTARRIVRHLIKAAIFKVIDMAGHEIFWDKVVRALKPIGMGLRELQIDDRHTTLTVSSDSTKELDELDNALAKVNLEMVQFCPDKNDSTLAVLVCKTADAVKFPEPPEERVLYDQATGEAQTVQLVSISPGFAHVQKGPGERVVLNKALWDRMKAPTPRFVDKELASAWATADLANKHTPMQTGGLVNCRSQFDVTKVNLKNTEKILAALSSDEGKKAITKILNDKDLPVAMNKGDWGIWDKDLGVLKVKSDHIQGAESGRFSMSKSSMEVEGSDFSDHFRPGDEVELVGGAIYTVISVDKREMVINKLLDGHGSVPDVIVTGLTYDKDGCGATIATRGTDPSNLRRTGVVGKPGSEVVTTTRESGTTPFNVAPGEVLVEDLGVAAWEKIGPLDGCNAATTTRNTIRNLVATKCCCGETDSVLAYKNVTDDAGWKLPDTCFCHADNQGHTPGGDFCEQGKKAKECPTPDRVEHEIAMAYDIATEYTTLPRSAVRKIIAEVAGVPVMDVMAFEDVTGSRGESIPDTCFCGSDWDGHDLRGQLCRGQATKEQTYSPKNELREAADAISALYDGVREPECKCAVIGMGHTDTCAWKRWNDAK